MCVAHVQCHKGGRTEAPKGLRNMCYIVSEILWCKKHRFLRFCGRLAPWYIWRFGIYCFVVSIYSWHISLYWLSVVNKRFIIIYICGVHCMGGMFAFVFTLFYIKVTITLCHPYFSIDNISIFLTDRSRRRQCLHGVHSYDVPSCFWDTGRDACGRRHTAPRPAIYEWLKCSHRTLCL